MNAGFESLCNNTIKPNPSDKKLGGINQGFVNSP
jgi:hypothetical protein